MRSPDKAAAAQGLLAAVLFGAGVPLAKLLLPSAAPGVLSGILYLGAGVALTLVRGLRSGSPGSGEVPLRRGDFRLLAGVVFFGGALGPFLLLSGLSRISGSAASLLLALEAPLTVLLAVAAFGDHLSRRAAAGIALVVAGGVPLALADGASSATLSGALLLAAASLSWAIENNLTQKLSLRDPAQIVQLKGLLGGGLTLVAALLLGEKLPALASAGQAALLGALSYGASVVWHIRAVRALGAARQAGLFATAPLFGAALSVALLGDRFPLLPALIMAPGVLLLLYEGHAHPHLHQPLAHEHSHVHDEHHQHAHAGAFSEPHSHWHEHDPLEHEHPHQPDAHHRHQHEHL